MSSLPAYPLERSPDTDRTRWRDYLLPSVERLRTYQLRYGSLYTACRAFVPTPVFIFFWVCPWSQTHESAGLFQQSITVRQLLLGCGVMMIWNAWLSFSVYSRRSAMRDLGAEILRLAGSSLCCSVLLLCAGLFRLPRSLVLADRLGLGLFGASMLLLLSFFLGAVVCPRWTRSRAAVIVGSGRRASMLRKRLRSHYSAFQLYGCLDNEYVGNNLQDDLYLGGIDQLESLLRERPIEAVLIALPVKSKYDQIQNVIQICESAGVESLCMEDIFETTLARAAFHRRFPDPITVRTTLTRDSRQILKRLVDITGGLALMLLLSPIMLAAAIAVYLSSPGPVFFVQQRYGLHRQRFSMFKFRSMVHDAEGRQAALEQHNEAQGPVFKLRKDPRVTKVGAFLRKTSIDELPQLFNVLRGEMSLVGPRPLPLRDVSRFEETWLLRRFSVRPGITCLWQVNGRSETSFNEWIRQDLLYIDCWSLLLDAKILLMTIPAVLRGSGAM